ncbi:hypothetical protein PoB_007135600 [Plakobranchus ocellatus]|uniref:Uncharacterized protein n=1 Tax=Plakobranchus ocellatus TaxID=259542 RepID=A0AAV4DLU7_9GAST|nr:hypothetical protein PoB_007135600 [Plakobranchus ocellatus]
MGRHRRRGRDGKSEEGVTQREEFERDTIGEGQRQKATEEEKENTLAKREEKRKREQESLNSRPFFVLWGVGGTVASESALTSAETLLSRVRARHRRPGLTEGPKA